MNTDSKIIYQHRFYLDKQAGWTDWETTSVVHYEEVKEYSRNGYRYQVRVLHEAEREGYLPTDEDVEDEKACRESKLGLSCAVTQFNEIT